MRLLGTSFVLSLLLGGCHGGSGTAWVADRNGQIQVIQHTPVKLPGLTFLQLGAKQNEVVDVLRSHGFDCNAEAGTSGVLACVRATLADDPTGGGVVLMFEQDYLAGVQVHLDFPSDSTGAEAQRRYDALKTSWSKDFGRPVEIHRPGITAARTILRDNTALVVSYYERDAQLLVPPSLTLEHVRVQQDNNINMATR